MSRSSPSRLLKFALVSLLGAYLTVNFGLAWIYTAALTHPACPADIQPLANIPPPEEHILQTADGAEQVVPIRLRAWYYPSKNRAAVLAVGGLQGALGRSLPPVEFLVREGYGVLQLDSRACATPTAPVTLGASEVQDAAAALNFLQSRREVDAARIGAFGFSMGGVTVIRAAARFPAIAAVVAEGGFHNLGEDMAERSSDQADAEQQFRSSLPRRFLLYNIAATFWLQTKINPWKVSPIDDLPNLSPRPILLIYGEGEQISGRAAEQFAAAGEPKVLWIVPGGDHGKNYIVASGEYERRVLEFFDKYLLAPR